MNDEMREENSVTESKTRSLREKALSYLSRREYTRLELRDKLLLDQFSAEEIDTLLDELQSTGLQSDERFSENYVRYRKAAGFGPDKIMYELQFHGVSKEIIEDKVKPHSYDWQRHLIALMERRFPEGLNTKEKRSEKFRFLTSRGFTTEEIFRYLNAKGIPEDDE